MVGVSSCGPVCSVTVTDRRAMQIGLSPAFAAVAGIAGYIGGRLEAALAPGTASRLAGPGKGARRTAAARMVAEPRAREAAANSASGAAPAVGAQTAHRVAGPRCPEILMLPPCSRS